jgi:hypothetical protein
MDPFQCDIEIEYQVFCLAISILIYLASISDTDVHVLFMSRYAVYMVSFVEDMVCEVQCMKAQKWELARYMFMKC